jgi:hypothetical protein
MLLATSAINLKQLKNNLIMKSRRKLVLILAVLVITMSSFIVKSKLNPYQQVMIYGIVYDNKCNSEAAIGYSTMLVSIDNYNAEQINLEKQLKSWYPHATKIKVNSSKYSYGNKASNSCVISWMKNNNNCSYKVISICFGATQQEAFNKAIALKNSYAGSKTDYNIEEQKYW